MQDSLLWNHDGKRSTVSVNFFYQSVNISSLFCKPENCGCLYFSLWKLWYCMQLYVWSVLINVQYYCLSRLHSGKNLSNSWNLNVYGIKYYLVSPDNYTVVQISHYQKFMQLWYSITKNDMYKYYTVWYQLWYAQNYNLIFFLGQFLYSTTVGFKPMTLLRY